MPGRRRPPSLGMRACAFSVRLAGSMRLSTATISPVMVAPGRATAEASTVAPVRQPLLQDLRLDVAMDGPIEYLGSFPIDLEAEGDVREIAEGAGRAELELVDGERSIRLELQVEEGIRFATGRLTLVDPEHGIDRTFMVRGSPSVIGIRVVSLSGTWIDTTDLPIASGKFRLAVRRR